MTEGWTEEDLEPFRELAAERLGLDVRASRIHDLRRALRVACQANGARKSAELYAILTAPGAEGRQALDDFLAHLLVGETHFFRHRAQFETIERRVLPEIVRRRRADRRLKIWSVGSASGEETYSLAMSLERVLPIRRGWDILVLGTDVDNRALERARRGLYSPWSFREVRPESLAGWLIPCGEGYEVAPRLRALVRFRSLNLARDEFPSAASQTNDFDLVLCRNVLMYLGQPTRKRVVERLQEALAPGGWLVVGATEPDPALFRSFEVEMSPAGILYRKPGAPNLSPPPSPEEPAIAEPPTSADRLAPAEARPADQAVRAYLRARAAADHGSLDEADRWLSIALSSDPLLAEAHHLRGLLLQERGDLNGALEALRRSTFASPKVVQVRLALGLLLARLQDTPRAIHVLRGVLHDLEALSPEEEMVGEGFTVGELRQLAEAQLGIVGAQGGA